MPETTLTERRRAERRPGGQTLKFYVDTERETIVASAFVIDLSELGARIRSETRLQAGDKIIVVPREGEQQQVPTQVVWVNRGGNGTGGEDEAGLAFLEPINLDA
jgi:PilZ domain